jgi:ketosteroid isomerase-like protein
MDPKPDVEDWQREIAALEAENRSAFLARDLEKLGRFLSDGFLVNSPLGTVNERERVLELLRTGVIAHASLESRIEAMRRFGDVVVVMGSETCSDTADGPERRRRFTNVWAAESGSWRIIARHANLVGDGP